MDPEDERCEERRFSKALENNNNEIVVTVLIFAYPNISSSLLTKTNDDRDFRQPKLPQ